MLQSSTVHYYVTFGVPKLLLIFSILYGYQSYAIFWNIVYTGYCTFSNLLHFQFSIKAMKSKCMILYHLHIFPPVALASAGIYTQLIRSFQKPEKQLRNIKKLTIFWFWYSAEFFFTIIPRDPFIIQISTLFAVAKAATRREEWTHWYWKPF